MRQQNTQRLRAVSIHPGVNLFNQSTARTLLFATARCLFFAKAIKQTIEVSCDTSTDTSAPGKK